MTSVLAIDQGTQSSKALIVGRGHLVRGRAAAPLERTFPQVGWVEQDAKAIWASVVAAADGVTGRVDGIGLSTQRETVVAWDARTGRPLGPALSWQDQRAVAICERLSNLADVVAARTGLLLDPMFSAAKIAWLLDAYDPDRSGARTGKVKVGTIDSWLLWRLTGRHLTEAGNASRTSLLDIATVAWDPELCEGFGVPIECLPEVVSSTPLVPTTMALGPAAAGTRVAAVLGDSHAALFANAGWQPGSVKASYGTGSSIMAVSDADVADGLCRTIAWDGSRRRDPSARGQHPVERRDVDLALRAAGRLGARAVRAGGPWDADGASGTGVRRTRGAVLGCPGRRRTRRSGHGHR